MIAYSRPKTILFIIPLTQIRYRDGIEIMITKRSPRTGHVPPPPRSKNINEAVREIKRPSPNHAPSVPAVPKRKFNIGRLAIVIALASALIGGTFTLVVWAISSLMSPNRSRTFVPLTNQSPP